MLPRVAFLQENGALHDLRNPQIHSDCALDFETREGMNYPTKSRG
jgi:hypothetical protein